MKKIKTIEFETVGDFVRAAARRGGPKKVSHTVGDAPFYGTTSFDEAQRLATAGWPEGVKRLTELRGGLSRVVGATIAARSKTLRFDVVGDYVDVGRFLTGEPECCGQYRDDADATCQSRVVKLVANVSAIGSVQSESIFSAGAAIFAAVDILESLGKRVELWLGSGSERHGDRKRLQVLVKLKEASQPFDADRVAFWLCSNASLRRMFFSVEQDHGYSPDNSITTPLELADGSIVTPEVQRDDNNQARRIARVIAVCESVGLTFTQEELAEATS